MKPYVNPLEDWNPDLDPFEIAMSAGKWCAFLYDYFPTRVDIQDDLEALKHRQLVWDFKDGINTRETTEILCEHFLNKRNFPLHFVKNPEEWFICVIPASTKDKTEKRFKLFCEIFSELTGCKNGYELIMNFGDRDAIHLTNEREESNILDHLQCQSLYSTKNIILFDDNYTSGKTFDTIVDHMLLKNGAENIFGLFLSQTKNRRD